MPHETGPETHTITASCPTGACLVVEVERTDGEPLSQPVAVKLTGPASREEATSGTPARATFRELPPGAYAIELALAGAEVEQGFEVVGEAPHRVELGPSEETALRIDVEGEDAWEVITAEAFHTEDPSFDEPAAGGEGEGEDEDEWEIVAAEAFGEE